MKFLTHITLITYIALKSTLTFAEASNTLKKSDKIVPFTGKANDASLRRTSQPQTLNNLSNSAPKVVPHNGQHPPIKGAPDTKHPNASTPNSAAINLQNGEPGPKEPEKSQAIKVIKKSPAQVNSPQEVSSKTSSLSNCSTLVSSRRAQCLQRHEVSFLGGGTLFDIPGYGGAYSYRLNSGFEWGIDGLKNSQNLISNQQKESLYYNFIAIKYTQIGLFWRRNILNFDSLFLKIDLAYRRSEVGMAGSKTTDYGDLDFSIGTKTDTFLASTSIANRYTFQNGFTLGCDWAGIAVPIKSKDSQHSEFNGDPDPELKKTSNKTVSIFKKPIPMIMMISLGWRF